MFRRTLLPIALLLVAVPGHAKTQPRTIPPSRQFLPSILQEVEDRYAKAETLLADFEQVNESAALKQKKVSSGNIAVKRPNKVRWQTLKPDPNLLVSDGKKFWYYTPPFDKDERGQLIERDSSQAQSKLAQALLSGSFSVAKDMKIRQDSATQFTLIPKKGTAGSVKQAHIQIEPRQLIIKKVILEHKGGNRSEITLSNIQLGKKLGDDVFIFETPPNTDRVTE
jgi:outer membrane lipoprotein carrier protein